MFSCRIPVSHPPEKSKAFEEDHLCLCSQRWSVANGCSVLQPHGQPSSRQSDFRRDPPGRSCASRSSGSHAGGEHRSLIYQAAASHRATRGGRDPPRHDGLWRRLPRRSGNAARRLAAGGPERAVGGSCPGDPRRHPSAGLESSRQGRLGRSTSGIAALGDDAVSEELGSAQERRGLVGALVVTVTPPARPWRRGVALTATHRAIPSETGRFARSPNGLRSQNRD
jgi:hypothetical protein